MSLSQNEPDCDIGNDEEQEHQALHEDDAVEVHQVHLMLIQAE